MRKFLAVLFLSLTAAGVVQADVVSGRARLPFRLTGDHSTLPGFLRFSPACRAPRLELTVISPRFMPCAVRIPGWGWEPGRCPRGGWDQPVFMEARRFRGEFEIRAVTDGPVWLDRFRDEVEFQWRLYCRR